MLHCIEDFLGRLVLSVIYSETKNMRFDVLMYYVKLFL